MFGFLKPCWYSYSYHNNQYIFGQRDMTWLRSSKRTLKPSKTKSPLGKHPNNLMPYKIIPRYGIGAQTNACCAAVHPCTTQEQTLYQRTCCCIIRTAAHIYSSCVRTRRAGGVERRGEAKTAIPAPCTCVVRRTTAVIFMLFFWSAMPSPVSGTISAYFRLYCCAACCCTIIVHTLCVRGLLDVFSAVCCAVLQSVRGVCPWVRGVFFFFCVIFSRLPAPRWHSSAYHY